MHERFVANDGFVKIPRCCGRYSINIEGVMVSKSGDKVRIDYSGEEPSVTADLWSGLREYPLAMVMAISFKPMRLPLDYWDRLKVGRIDGDARNTHPRNLVWQYPSGGFEHPFLPGYNYIPGFSRYAIDRYGRVHDTSLGRLLITRQSPDGYYRYRVTPDVGKAFSTTRHRLMALAWLEYPATVDRLDVNHLNGIRGSDDLDNLEWATRKRNCDHAYSTGLRNDNHPVEVMDVVTGEVVTYYSYEDCSRTIGCDGETVRLRVRSKGQVLYPGNKLFRRVGEKKPWKVVDDANSELRRSGVASVILAMSVLDRTVQKFDSAAKAAKALNLSRASVNWQLTMRDEKTPRPHKGYLFKYVDDPRPWPEYTDDQVRVFMANPKSLAKGVLLVDKDTGEELRFMNRQSAAIHFNCTAGYIYDAIKDGCLIRNQYRATWLN